MNRFFLSFFSKFDLVWVWMWFQILSIIFKDRKFWKPKHGFEIKLKIERICFSRITHFIFNLHFKDQNSSTRSVANISFKQLTYENHMQRSTLQSILFREYIHKLRWSFCYHFLFFLKFFTHKTKGANFCNMYEKLIRTDQSLFSWIFFKLPF